MKKVGKLILIILIILLVVVMVLLYWLSESKKKNIEVENTYSNTNTPDEFIEIDKEAPIQYTNTSIQKLNSTSILLSIQECIDKYYEYNYLGDYNAIYNLLDDDYKKNKKINESNVFQNIDKVEQRTKFFAIKVNQKEISFDHEYKYYVYGSSYSETYREINKELFIVNLDVYNLTFTISPYGTVNEEQYSNIMKNIMSSDTGAIEKTGDSKSTEIKSNNYNSFEVKTYENLTKNIIENYYKLYYFFEVNDVKKSYELLDNEYRNNKFDNENNYYSYVEKNKDSNINISYVKKEESNDETIYIGIDSKGCYYIIKEKSVLDFKLLLDSYSAPLQETRERYNSASDIERACMCLETVKEMINKKDYSNIYKHLNETFKRENFENVNKLEQELKAKYFEKVDFKYTKYKKEGESFVITVDMSSTDSDQQNQDKVTKNDFIIKLGNGITDFELSFNVN